MSTKSATLAGTTGDNLRATEDFEGKAPIAVEPIRRIAYRLDEVARSLGVSRRLLERERAAGRFPAPDITIGTAPLWRPATVDAWVAAGGLIKAMGA